MPNSEVSEMQTGPYTTTCRSFFTQLESISNSKRCDAMPFSRGLFVILFFPYYLWWSPHKLLPARVDLETCDTVLGHFVVGQSCGCCHKVWEILLVLVNPSFYFYTHFWYFSTYCYCALPLHQYNFPEKVPQPGKFSLVVTACECSVHRFRKEAPWPTGYLASFPR